MALNEYGIDSALWARLTDDERADIAASTPRRVPPPPPAPPASPPAPYPVYIPGTSSTYDVTPGGIQYAHDVTAFAYAHGETTVHPPEPPRTTAGTPPASPAQIVWAWVRSLNSFPGNHPYFDADRAAGVNGYMLKADDPYLVPGAAACHGAGFRVGVWDGPHGESGDAFAARMVTAAHNAGAEAIAPDMEFESKGGAGSPGWQENADAANGIRSRDAGIPVIVTPMPLQDDFNYAAWVNIGADVAVQGYGAELSDVYDPRVVRDRVIANGVPADRVTVILPAGSLVAGVATANDLGLGWWGIYTIDDVTGTDRSIPFGASPGGPAGPPSPTPPDDSQPPGGSAPPPSAPAGGDVFSVYVPPDSALPDDDADDAYDAGEEGDESDDLVTAGEISAELWADFLADEDDPADYELGSGSSAGGDVLRI